MSTTKVAVTIDGLIAACQAAGLTVVDGPPIQQSEIGEAVLYVGWQGTDGTEAARTQQEWAGIGPGVRNEAATILCYAEVTLGGTAMKPTRDTAIAVVEAVETIVRDDELLGVLARPDYVQFGGVDSHAALQTSAGSRWGIAFHLDLFARL